MSSKWLEAAGLHTEFDLGDYRLEDFHAGIPLRLGFDDVPAGELVVGPLEHVLYRPFVLFPLLPVAPVVLGELPRLQHVFVPPMKARELLIGPRPAHRVVAARVGKSRTYSGLGYEVVHLHIAPHLAFGYTATDGVQLADAEKAVLDVLYFHLRGRRYPFDIYSDIDFVKLDQGRLRSYLERYRNPKFVAFVRGLLRLP